MLSFIINSKVNVQRSFLIYPHCEYALHWSAQLLLLLSLPSYPPLFNSFQYIALYPLPPQMLCISILLTFNHSFSLPPPPSSIH
jgi:hypothetical protein